MALKCAAVDTDGLVRTPDRFQMPEKSISKAAANTIIRDKLMLQGKPRLNLASPVSTWNECDKLILQAIHNNYVDTDEYPDITELQNRCVHIIADLFRLGDGEEAVGVATVASWEGIMLAGLAFKRKWELKRMKKNKPCDKPNIVTGVNVQVCWEKFAQYFKVEHKEVKLTEGSYVMDPVKAVDMVDENTICVVAMLCSPYNGEFEDVEKLNHCLVEKGWDTPIHVDATNGGFIAPFLDLELKWDFRLPLVKSINVSGQKHGLVHPRIGWVIWRAKQDLPKEVTFPINYLSADRPHFTVNFCEGPSQIIAQYYQFIRLGFEGYQKITRDCVANAKALAEDLATTGQFNILSSDRGIPLVAFSLNGSSGYDEYEISDHLRRLGWIVSAHTMVPEARNVKFLCVVARQDFSRIIAGQLVRDGGVVFDLLPPKSVTELTASPGVSHPETPQKESNALPQPENVKKRKLNFEDTDEKQVKRKAETKRNEDRMYLLRPKRKDRVYLLP